MREVICRGTPAEVSCCPPSRVNVTEKMSQIGRQHGKQAKAAIHGSLAFYTDFYKRKSAMDWDTASQCAERFVPMLEEEWPQYLEEIKGQPDLSPSSVRAVLMP